MKYLKFLLFFIVCATYGQAGVTPADSPQSAARMSLFFLELGKKLDDNFSLEDVEGSPYLYDNFVLGEVSINNKVEGMYPLRLNVYNDIFEIKTDESSIKEMRQLHYVEVNLQNQLYRLVSYLKNDKVISKGYFEVLEEGKNVILLKKNEKIFVPGAKAKTGFYKDKKPQIKNDASYYLSFKINSNVPVKIEKLSSKEVLKAFPEDRYQILKSYIKDEKLNLKDIDDLKKVVRYYNNL